MRSNTEAMQLLEQLLRAQPRNGLVAEVCGELRDRIIDHRVIEAEPPKLQKFDRGAYQREYMREYMKKRRALAK